MKKLVFIIFLGLAGCASATKYHSRAEDGGYEDGQLDTNYKISRFVGNALTSAETSNIYTQVRALEVCRESGFKLAKIVAVVDQTTSKTATNTKTNVFANPDGPLIGMINSKTSTKTYVYPTFAAAYFCANADYRLGIIFKLIEAEEMKPFVKDLMGAVQVNSILEGSPNNGRVQTGDLVTKVNGRRVDSIYNVIYEVHRAGKEQSTLTLFREGRPMEVKVQSIDSTAATGQEFEGLLARACVDSNLKKRSICAGR